MTDIEEAQRLLADYFERRPNAEEVADILDRAADYFLDHPWVQRTPMTDDGGRCLVSSVSTAAWDPRICQALNLESIIPFTAGWSHEALLAVQKHLGKRRIETLPRWNDDPERTVDDVIEALRATAKKVREGEIVV